MIDKQLQDQLSLLLIRSSLRGKYGLLQIAESNGITLMQALTLCLLEPDQPTPMSALSTFLTCDPSSVSGIVDRLVVKGFIVRKEGDQDRRVKNVTLTEKGLELRLELLRFTAEKRLPNLHEFTQTEVKELIHLLKKATNTVS